MRNLVTGATGFLGSNLIKHLLSRNEDVIAMVRRTSNLRRLEGVRDKVEIRYASLDDYASLLGALKGVDRLYHLAAHVRIGSMKKLELFRDNVIGSENVLNAAFEQKIAEVIYVSSIAIFGSAIEDVVSENDVKKGMIMSTYGETKLASYYKSKDAYSRGLNIKVAIPSNIFGPDDPNFGPLIKNYIQKHLKIIAGNLNANIGMIHVDDACEGIIRVATLGKPGQSYILNAENITLRNIFLFAEQITGIRSPRFKVPKPIIMSAAALSDLAGRVLRKKLLLNLQSARLLYTTHPIFDSSKARTELSWRPVPFDRSFRDTIEWYQKQYGKKRNHR